MSIKMSMKLYCYLISYCRLRGKWTSQSEMCLNAKVWVVILRFLLSEGKTFSKFAITKTGMFSELAYIRHTTIFQIISIGTFCCSVSSIIEIGSLK